jgi:hypothetical protein
VDLESFCQGVLYHWLGRIPADSHSWQSQAQSGDGARRADEKLKATGSPVRTKQGRAAVMLWRSRVSADGRLKGGWRVANQIERCGTHAGTITIAPFSRTPCLCLLASSVFLCAGASAAPVLRCVLESTGDIQVHEAVVTNDPYAVRPVSINDHFRFKAVMMSDAQGSGIEYIKIYTYYTSTRGPVLLHQITYNQPPVSREPDARSLTGLQWAYSPRLERQFQFECHLLEKNR